MSNHPEKKLPFNHQSHLTKYNADCGSCHGFSDDGRFKGIPTVAQCTVCHDRQGPISDPDPNVPRKKPMFANYKDEAKPWGSFAQQPDLVYFSHKVVMTAKHEDGRLKARCGSCHGDKAHSTEARGIKGKMPMGQCMDCHTSLNISNKCAVCHD